MMLLVEPGHYRAIAETITQHTKGKGKVEVLDLCVQELGSIKFGDDEVKAEEEVKSSDE